MSPGACPRDTSASDLGGALLAQFRVRSFVVVVVPPGLEYEAGVRLEALPLHEQARRRRIVTETRAGNLATLHSRVLFVMATDHEYREHLRARIAPLIAGVGPVEAAIGTTIRLEQLRVAEALPDLVVSLGSAGSRRCELGGVYQIEAVSWRDIDASPIGFPPGITPFADHGRVIALPTPLSRVPCATLSTGSDIVVGDRYAAIDADLVDMETFAVLRACQRFVVPMMGLRGVSDGPGELDGVSGWTELLPLLDERLASAVDLLVDWLATEGRTSSGS